MIDASQQLGMGSGFVVGVPIPAEAATEGEMVEQAITTSLEEAQSKNIKGNEVGRRSVVV